MVVIVTASLPVKRLLLQSELDAAIQGFVTQVAISGGQSPDYDPVARRRNFQ